MALRRRAGRGLATVAAAVGALLVLPVGPVMADADMGHTGTVGFHRLRDTGSSNPGATCTYRGVYPSPGGYSYEGKLKFLTVRPPKVKAISGSQQVGWQFMAQREANPGSAWITTYTSGIQKTTTNSRHLASFTEKGINVRVPSNGADDEPFYIYRVLVKVFWYFPNGAVQGTATHRVEYYREVFNNWPGGGTFTSDTKPYCYGWEGFEID